MESIEKLRELACDINGNEIVDHMQIYPSCVFDGAWLDAWHRAFDKELEALEREIEVSYMRLPVDADGVPIHVGEEMTCHGDVFNVCAVAPAKIHRWVVAKLPEKTTTYSYDPMECTHYKPRTLEDVLMDAGISRAAINDVADEIRELLSKAGD